MPSVDQSSAQRTAFYRHVRDSLDSLTVPSSDDRQVQIILTKVSELGPAKVVPFLHRYQILSREGLLRIGFSLASRCPRTLIENADQFRSLSEMERGSLFLYAASQGSCGEFHTLANHFDKFGFSDAIRNPVLNRFAEIAPQAAVTFVTVKESLSREEKISVLSRAFIHGASDAIISIVRLGTDNSERLRLVLQADKFSMSSLANALPETQRKSYYKLFGATTSEERVACAKYLLSKDRLHTAIVLPELVVSAEETIQVLQSIDGGQLKGHVRRALSTHLAALPLKPVEGFLLYKNLKPWQEEDSKDLATHFRQQRSYADALQNLGQRVDSERNSKAVNGSRDRAFRYEVLSYLIAKDHEKVNACCSKYTESLSGGGRHKVISQLDEISALIRDVQEQRSFGTTFHPSLEAFNDETLQEIRFLREFIEEFGGRPTLLPKVYEAMYRIKQGGGEGLRQLRARRNLLVKLLFDEKNIKELLSLDLIDAELVSYLILGHSQYYGPGTAQHIQSKIRSFANSLEGGNISPLRAEWTPGVMKVKTLDVEAIEEFILTEPCVEKMGQFRADLQVAILKQPEICFAEEKHRLWEHFNHAIDELSRPLTSEELKTDSSLSRIKGREDKAQRLKVVMLEIGRSASPLHLLKVLTITEEKSTSVMNSSIRRLTMLLGIAAKVPMHIEESLAKPNTIGTISAFLEYIDDTVTNHVLPTLNLGKQSLRRLRSAFNASALQEDLDRLRLLESKGSMEIGVSPTRGVLGELSGEICAACWYNLSNIMMKYPKLTPIIFTKYPNTPRETIVGGTLIIETENKRKQKVFIVRGFNPTQNLLSQVDAGSMFDQFMEYLIPRASTMLVSHLLFTVRQGAQTNRPQVRKYLAQYAKGLPIMNLSDSAIAKFNSYDVTNDCVVAGSFHYEPEEIEEYYAKHPEER